MQLTPYIETLSLSKEEQKKKNAPQKAHTQKKRAELEVAKLEEKISELEQRIVNLASTESLEFSSILEAQDELALAERRLVKFNELISQLFPTTPV